MYVEVLTKLLEAEDKVLAKDYKAARVIIDAVVAKYPLIDNKPSSSDLWWNNYWEIASRSAPRPHTGEPGVYAALRMLDEITRVGVTKPLVGSTPITMVIVMPACSNIVPKSGPTLVNHRLSPEIEENSYEVVRQSLRLFQSYILAISDGNLRLELQFHKVDTCFDINEANGYVFGNYDAPIYRLPEAVRKKADMFWILYPSDYSEKVDIGGGSGMGGVDYGINGWKPVFISEDDWVLKRNEQQGGGFRTEVERRMYLPEWIQHEFFHHLFASWPELSLEPTDHSWFNRYSWPSNFVGAIEEDYYSEALRQRLYMATPSIAQKLQRATN